MDVWSSGASRRPRETDLEERVDEAADAAYTQARLRDLIRINHELTSNLDMPKILQRIVELGRELLNARYVAIGILGDERRIKELIHAGMDQEVVDLIGRVPEGRGLLGALIDEPGPVRLESLEDDDRWIGFPKGHPRMRSFLGVPIRVHNSLYGTLYIADSLTGSFSAADEELAEALAGTAGIAIQNARLFDASTYRATWSAALADLARSMDNDDEDHLGHIVDEVRRLASADLAFVALVPPDGQAVVERAAGTEACDLSDLSFPLDDLVLTEAIFRGEAVLAEGLSRAGTGGLAIPALFGPSMLVPFTRQDESLGVLAVCREIGKGPFTARDLEMGKAFATHINVSFQRRELLRTRQRVAVLEDRGRIARDLHDHVIQRLFATGLNLEGVAAMVDGDAAVRIAAQVDDIDSAIAQIRHSIFALRHEAGPGTVNLRTRILQIIDRVTGQSPGTTHVVLAGPVDTVVSGSCREDVAAVVTEALMNVVRHAEATRVDVAVSVTPDAVSVEVTDDGIGPGAGQELSGLANLRRRAESQGGSFDLQPVPGGGTQLAWSVPV
ncbi:GAF domain-containing protein [Aeromicrobium chenweiae]|uniref:Histidine kinase n=1 Tax=Aeromicrobium chenweiae TaxID=2079793 RepID=A0A2S0WM01_9ACTN|nr:GAF domain-containing protein [Aeromicrobium chenweiae]AWB92345.1 histidine kinase [Aeromicrobium chenweiae]TGN31368.1 GAF domain-containing protein [Aeromicrobium chenweiae]